MGNVLRSNKNGGRRCDGMEKSKGRGMKMRRSMKSKREREKLYCFIKNVGPSFYLSLPFLSLKNLTTRGSCLLQTKASLSSPFLLIKHTPYFPLFQWCFPNSSACSLRPFILSPSCRGGCMQMDWPNNCCLEREREREREEPSPIKRFIILGACCCLPLEFF